MTGAWLRSFAPNRMRKIYRATGSRKIILRNCGIPHRPAGGRRCCTTCRRIRLTRNITPWSMPDGHREPQAHSRPRPPRSAPLSRTCRRRSSRSCRGLPAGGSAARRWTVCSRPPGAISCYHFRSASRCSPRCDFSRTRGSPMAAWPSGCRMALCPGYSCAANTRHAA